MVKTLANLNIGDKATIVKINSNSKMLERLTDFGLTDGCEVFVVSFAPLGDPILIKARGCLMAIRKSDAKIIEVI